MSEFRLSLVLDVSYGLIINWVEDQTSYRRCAQQASTEVIMQLTVKDVATRLRDCADDTSERAADSAARPVVLT